MFISYYMQFNKTTTISIGRNTKPIFESLEKIRPAHMSFSLMLALAVEEYVQNHDGKNSKITEFDSNAISTKFPLVMATVDKWNVCVESLSNDEILKLQDRVAQITNLVRREVSKRV